MYTRSNLPAFYFSRPKSHAKLHQHLIHLNLLCEREFECINFEEVKVLTQLYAENVKKIDLKHHHYSLLQSLSKEELDG
jgi:hypothetical protein